jgi:hypothetical protein
MVEDSILVALIRESLDAPERPRRLAALVILEVLRRGNYVAGAEMLTIEADSTASVADEIRDLRDKYGL